MTTATHLPLSPLPEAEMDHILAEFHRDGYCILRNVLTPDEIEALITAIDRIFIDERFAANRQGPFIAVRLFETHPIFEQMLTREPIITLVERLLGDDCHLIAENAVRNRPGEAISQFHVDDLLIFPVAEGMDRHDPRLTMPVHVLTVQMPLTPVHELADGPSQYIPGSHYSGRQPNDSEHPDFEGRQPVSIFTEPGDLYLHNGQCWHRGAPNTSEKTRYLFQLSFSRRWVSQRFYPFVNYQLPPGVYERADQRRRRVLGFHTKGAYG